MPVSKNRRKKPQKPKSTPTPKLQKETTTVSQEPEPLMMAIGSDSGAAVALAPHLEIVDQGDEAPEPTPVPLLTLVANDAPGEVLSEPAASAQEAAPAAIAEAAPPRESASTVLETIDAFGRDPAFEKSTLKKLEFMYRRYFRVEARGIEHVPSTGPAILVANHSGALPWDGAMLKCALAFDHPSHRTLRPLAENNVFHFPFLGVMFNRFGAVRACQENAEALLDAGEAVAVFPEGVKGLGKTFGKRYQLQRFGRGGFVKLAMRTKAPIIPVAIVGAEEAHPLIARLVKPAAALGLPYLPVTPTFPWLGPLGLVPLPTKWFIEFGEPIFVDEQHAGGELEIEKLTEDVRSDIQSRIDKLLAQRKTWFG
jgi:1-acyl-sn-glycerol-3-phosphate acyltransferase